jgi:hypothetical protein
MLGNGESVGNHPSRLSPQQKEMLLSLPRLGREWLCVDLWSSTSIDRLKRLRNKGLVDIWIEHIAFDGMHARLTVDGDRLVREIAQACETAPGEG